MYKHCPGMRSIVDPKIIIRTCPYCGDEVEFFEYETVQKCYNCGREVYREPSEVCITWCNYADKCIEELESKSMIDHNRAEELRKILADSK
jgi:NADH pyrophosphatase NudC (nudix superfamily)